MAVDHVDLAPAPARYSYDAAQRFFHWTMAAIILTAIALGVATSFMVPGTSPRRELLDIHKSLGMTALVLVALRIVWRLVRGEPPYREPLDALSHAAARAAHIALYTLMLVMPATGYLFSAAGGYSLPWFGLFRWPRILPLDKPLSLLGETLHDRIAWIICGLLVLHLAAVAWHRWVKKDEVLGRMLP